MIRTLISCLIVLCATAAAPAKDNQAIIPFQEGSIRLTFLNDNAVRVEYAKEFSDTLPEWIYVNESPRIGKLNKTELQNGITRISAGKIKADIDRNKRAVTITDAQGRPVFTTRDITLYSTDNPDGTRDTGAQLS
ncbi:alpha-glucosidase domain-containing protein, partial [uncultured Muribaculum sp.]